MDRLREQFTGGALLDDLSRVHDGDAVREFGDESEVVGDKQHCEAQLLAEGVEQLDYLRLGRHIECGGGFVGDHQRGSRVRAMAMSTR